MPTSLTLPRLRLLVPSVFPLLIVAVLMAPEARGQLTAETLLEPMVEEYGPQYQDVEQALQMLRDGRVREAREALAAARQKNPDLPPANIMFAHILFRSQQVAAARAALEEAVQEAPEDPAAYIYLAELALQQRRLTESKLLYEKGLAVCNKYTANAKRKNRLLVNAYGGLALLAESREDWPQAKQLLEAMLKIDQDNSVGMARYGRVLFKMATSRSGYDDAYKVYQRLQSMEENAARAEVNMALLFEQDGKRNNAETLMKRAVEQDGNDVRTRLAVAKWAIDVGKLDMAKEHATVAAQLDPK